MEKFKRLFIIFTISIGGLLPLVSIINRKPLLNYSTRVNGNQFNTSVLKTHGRVVNKFMGVHNQSIGQQFQKLKEQLASSNINIDQKSSSHYNYLIKYDNYDSFGVEHHGYESTSNKNTKNNHINVGIKLIQNMTIKIVGRDQWKSFSFEHNTLNPAKISPGSVEYYISATGSKLSPTITLRRSFTYRDKNHNSSDQIGYFNINNLNNNIKHAFTSTYAYMIYTIIISIIILLVGIVFIRQLDFPEKINISPIKANGKDISVSNGITKLSSDSVDGHSLINQDAPRLSKRTNPASNKPVKRGAVSLKNKAKISDLDNRNYVYEDNDFMINKQTEMEFPDNPLFFQDPYDVFNDRFVPPKVGSATDGKLSELDKRFMTYREEFNIDISCVDYNHISFCNVNYLEDWLTTNFSDDINTKRALLFNEKNRGYLKPFIRGTDLLENVHLNSGFLDLLIALP